MKHKRRKIIIDAKRQLKTALVVFAINGTVIILMMLLLSFVSNQLTHKVAEAAEAISYSVQTETDIVNAFSKFAESVSSDIFDLKNSKLMTDHQKSISTLAELSEQLQKTRFYMRILIALLIALQCLQTFLIIRYAIILSHRIIGPEFFLSRVVRQLARKKPVEIRSLRKKDFLHNLNQDISHLAHKMNLVKAEKNKKSLSKNHSSDISS
jgi:hypothetical protein